MVEGSVDIENDGKMLADDSDSLSDSLHERSELKLPG